MEYSHHFCSNIFTWQTYNALFIIRSVCKYLVEHLSEDLLIQQFDAKPAKTEGMLAVVIALQLISLLLGLIHFQQYFSFTFLVVADMFQNLRNFDTSAKVLGVICKFQGQKPYFQVKWNPCTIKPT